MSTRPLRHFYDHHVALEVDNALGSVIEPWRRHRHRFLESLQTLDDREWRSTTRCDAWDARDVLCHLITVDGFFVVSLTSAANGSPTSYLAAFDPSATPESLVAPMREKTTEEILDQFAAGQATLEATVDAFKADQWSLLGESPVGHVTARLVLAHAFWDSWLHERDIFEPLGRASDIETDELFTATWYSLFVGGAQGGLLNDDEPVGPGLMSPIEVTIGFDDLPDHDLHVRYDDSVHLTPAASPADVIVPALDLIESFCRPGPAPGAIERLPADMRAHLNRAAEIL